MAVTNRIQTIHMPTSKRVYISHLVAFLFIVYLTLENPHYDRSKIIVAMITCGAIGLSLLYFLLKFARGVDIETGTNNIKVIYKGVFMNSTRSFENVEKIDWIQNSLFSFTSLVITFKDGRKKKINLGTAYIPDIKLSK